MPTKREREYYRMGFADGQKWNEPRLTEELPDYPTDPLYTRDPSGYGLPRKRKPKRKLSAWNKYVKANSKKPRFRYRNGKLNLKKMAIAFRKTPAGRKKKKRR